MMKCLIPIYILRLILLHRSRSLNLYRNLKHSFIPDCSLARCLSWSIL